MLGAALALMQQPTSAQNLAYSVFERYLESLRVQAAIPGLSALIVQDGRVAWERGFGYADVEKSIAALPDTPYPIIDITQTFASVLLLQCEERGTLRLEDPLSTWSARVMRPSGKRSPTPQPRRETASATTQQLRAVDLAGRGMRWTVGAAQGRARYLRSSGDVRFGPRTRPRRPRFPGASGVRRGTFGPLHRGAQACGNVV